MLSNGTHFYSYKCLLDQVELCVVLKEMWPKSKIRNTTVEVLKLRESPYSTALTRGFNALQVQISTNVARNRDETVFFL